MRSRFPRLRSTGHIVPVTVVAAEAGTYDYVSGLIRIPALERLDQAMIPALVLEGADEEVPPHVASALATAAFTHPGAAAAGHRW